MIKLIKQKYQDLKQRLRGFKRIQPNGVRGRVYSPSGQPVNPSTARIVKATPKPELTATVLRKDGTVEVYKSGRAIVEITHPDGRVEVKTHGKVNKLKGALLTLKEKALRLLNK
jgi:hypothetical protein